MPDRFWDIEVMCNNKFGSHTEDPIMSDSKTLTQCLDAYSTACLLQD